MTQRPLFAKAKRIDFKRPRRETSRYGDRRRVWFRDDNAVKIVYSTTIAGVAIPPSFKVVALLDNGEYLISRHRRLTAAMRAARRVKDQSEPTTQKRRTVKR